jgi:hypothetical protein
MKTRVFAALLGIVMLGSMAGAREPWSIVGFGTSKCSLYVNASKGDANEKSMIVNPMFAWAQGWFSSRNARSGEKPLTVGGSLSADALQAMLVTQCEQTPEFPFYVAVDALYDRLAKTGL